MIQRIQTVYLLATTVLIALIFVFPIAEYIDVNNQIFQLNYLYFKSISESIVDTFVLPISFFVIAISILSFITIFLFKNRILQLRLTTFSLILIVFLILLNTFYTYKFSIDVNSKPTFCFSFLSPIIALITTYLARFNIKKDINLIRSSDRIR
jgi:CDP-diglyceride synthetase